MGWDGRAAGLWSTPGRSPDPLASVGTAWSLNSSAWELPLERAGGQNKGQLGLPVGLSRGHTVRGTWFPPHAHVALCCWLLGEDGPASHGVSTSLQGLAEGLSMEGKRMSRERRLALALSDLPKALKICFLSLSLKIHFFALSYT